MLRYHLDYCRHFGRKTRLRGEAVPQDRKARRRRKRNGEIRLGPKWKLQHREKVFGIRGGNVSLGDIPVISSTGQENGGVRKRSLRNQGTKETAGNLVACARLLCFCRGRCFTCTHDPRPTYTGNNLCGR